MADSIISKHDFYKIFCTDHLQEFAISSVDLWANFQILMSTSPFFNPIPTGLWNDVTNWGGGIMARTDFRLSKMTKRPVSAQNLLSNEYFDL